MGYINSGIEQGATVHYSGEEKKSDGYFIQPTIFTDTTPDMKIVQEEIFGPVVVIIKFKDEADVVRQANETVYGLAAVVFSQNITRALETTHRLKAGTVWVSTTTVSYPLVLITCISGQLREPTSCECPLRRLQAIGDWPGAGRIRPSQVSPSLWRMEY